MSILCILNGALPNLLLYYNLTAGSCAFRWGPRSYEHILEVASAVAGMTAIAFGLWGLRGVRRWALPDIFALKCFLRVHATWTCMWFLFVALPVEVIYQSVPAVDAWPLRAMPGMPKRLVVHPAWPHGMPSLCMDMLELESAVEGQLEKQVVSDDTGRLMTWFLRGMCSAGAEGVIPTCRGAMQLFTLWMTGSVAFWIYSAWVVGCFHKTVLHGGDGAALLAHFNRPSVSAGGARLSTRELLRENAMRVFKRMDANHDGLVSQEEFLSFLEANSVYFGHGCSQLPGS